jgi:hypothetical protein
MDRQAAIALIVYLQRGMGVVPTTGAEWDAVRRAVSELERIANTAEPVAPDPKSGALIF